MGEYEKDKSLQADTRKETDKKCPACGGVMDFSPSTGKMVCPYCGTEEEIQTKEEKFVAKELDFEAAEDNALCDWGTATKTVICKSCGAQSVYDVNQIADECPYCGSNQVMEAGDSQVMAPGGVVVFKIEAKEASARFKKWIGRKFFCPKLAKESAKPKAFKGIYIPFWTFDAKTQSQYVGQYGLDRKYKDKDGNEHTRTDWFGARGRYHLGFDDMLECGSSQQSSWMISDVGPFDTKDVKEYKPEYLAGFTAERYTVKMKDAWEKARINMKAVIRREIEAKIRRDHHADHVRIRDIQTQFDNITYKYLLLPIWISSFTYKGKVYQFVVNGQTGKVSGKTPVSWPKILLVAAAVLAFFLVISYIMG